MGTPPGQVGTPPGLNGVDGVYTPGKTGPIGQEQPSTTQPNPVPNSTQPGGIPTGSGGLSEQPVEDTSMVLCLPVNTQGFEDARGDQMSITTQAIMKKGVRVSHET